MDLKRAGAVGSHPLGLKAFHAASLSGEGGAIKVAFSSKIVVVEDTE